MIRIWHITGRKSETLVSGTREDLHEVKRLLERGGEATVAARTDGDPAPYTCWLGYLRIEPSDAPDTISVLGDALVLSAAPDGFVRLASFFDIPEEYTKGYHIHHEYIAGDPYVSESSLPVVIAPEPLES